MILLTVGTQLPFDRLVEAVDKLASRFDEKIVGQIGKTAYIPSNIEVCERLSPIEFDELVRSSRAIISHAGIGSIINAQRYNKPIIVMPRLARYGEHRNDHQLATCRQLSKYAGIFVVHSQADIEKLFEGGRLDVAEDTSEHEGRRRDFCENLRKYFE